jgi:adenylate cyclase
VVALLNDYLTQMTDIVLEHKGVVDKYIGDAIMAFWGAPIDAPDHAPRAVAAALEMKRKCDALRPVWREQYGHEVWVRAGINTGDAVVGNMGSKHKYNYTVMGDMVNLAARLEGANKAYGTYLMVSETTHEATRDQFVFRELDDLAVKGKEQPVRVYEVLGEAGEFTADELVWRDRFEAGLARYRAREFEAAIGEFEAVLDRVPNDSPATRYIDRCRRFIDDPPPADWDGVWRMKEK